MGASDGWVAGGGGSPRFCLLSGTGRVGSLAGFRSALAATALDGGGRRAPCSFFYTTPTPHYFFRLWEASTRAPHLILFSVVRGALVLLCFHVLFWALLVTGFGYLLSRGWVAIFREQNFLKKIFEIFRFFFFFIVPNPDILIS